MCLDALALVISFLSFTGLLTTIDLISSTVPELVVTVVAIGFPFPALRRRSIKRTIEMCHLTRSVKRTIITYASLVVREDIHGSLSAFVYTTIFNPPAHHFSPV